MLIVYELNKIKREIECHGSSYTAYRYKLDKNNEPTEEVEQVTTFGGLFHTEKGYISRNVSDGTTTKSKWQPKLLVSYEDGKSIKDGDLININNKTYKVVDKNNIQEYNIIYDISLEVIISESRY